MTIYVVLKRKKVIHLSKAKRLLDILIFASAKKAFTAQEIADEFNISVRTVHRYILDLSDMGLPIYAEQGRNGGYKVLTTRSFHLSYLRKKKQSPSFLPFNL